MKSIYLLKKDLRLQDNEVFLTLEKETNPLACIYFVTPDERGSQRKKFLYESLHDLAQKLEALGQQLWVTHKTPMEIAKSNREALLWFTSASYNSKDQAIVEDLQKELSLFHGTLQVTEQQTLIEAAELPFSLEDLPDTFSPFRRKVEKKGWAQRTWRRVSSLPGSWQPSGVQSFNEALGDWHNEEGHPFIKGGESSAFERIQHFFQDTQCLSSYKETRNGLMEWDDSSKLSPYLCVGSIHPLRIYSEVLAYEKEFGANESTYWLIFELLWRDYFKFYAFKHQKKLFSLEGPLGKKMSPKSDDLFFQKWCCGETGQDFVDANMKELLHTGWMSNRGRQNVASYLAKEAGLDWRWGAEWFAAHLIDDDTESNWGNWAYLAGVGADPRDKVFNCERQSEMYDPNREYRRRFLG